MTRVTLAITCMIDGFAPEVGEATVQCLRDSGCDVTVPLDQTCCGQPAWNSGFIQDAAKVAANTMDALEADGGDAIVVPAGSCATMMRKFWPELFELVGDSDRAKRAAELAGRTFEFSEFLNEHRPEALLARAGTSPPEMTVAYHHSCHMLRELGIREAPLELLKTAGMTVTEWADSERCCGFGGMFSLKLPEVSVAMADEKLASFSEGETTTLVGCDISCLLHIRARAEHEGVPIQIRHLAEVLVASRDSS